MYPGRRFTDYVILGDDIVIGDRLVASDEIDKCNVKIYLEKDWVSKTLEFAKRFFVSGVRVDCSPVSVRMWRSLVNPIVSPPFL